MKAVILAGGQGTRLWPLTSDLPKSMIPVMNRPFLQDLLLRMKSQGILDAILTLSYLPSMVVNRFPGGDYEGVRLSYTVEPEPLGTAGAVKNIEDQLNDTFVVLNGDIFTDQYLGDVVDFHKKMGAQATIVLTKVENPSAYGVVEHDRTGRVTRFVEKPTQDQIVGEWVNAGTYLLEPSVLDHIPNGQYYMFEQGLFPDLLEKGLPVYCYKSPAYWMDIGTPKNYLQLHYDLLLGNSVFQPAGDLLGLGIWAGEGCLIGQDVELRPPLVLGDGCSVATGARVLGPAVLGANCTIGERAVLDKVVLWDGVHVEADTSLSRCVLAKDVWIGFGATVKSDCILASGVVVGPQIILPSGSMVGPGDRI